MMTNWKKTAAAAAAAVMFLALYRHVLVKLVHDWWTDDNYSHGFLIIPLAIYLAWERRDRFATTAGAGSWWGLPVIAGSIAVLLAGVLGSELFLTRISLVGTVVGSVLFLFGWSRLLVMAFPIGMLLLMIPLPAIIFNQIAFPLQLLASRVGEATLSSVEIPVLREGNVLVLANTSLEVAEACSGIRSLVSLLTLGIVFGYFTDRRLWVRITIALSTIPIAIIANGGRVAGTGIAAHRFGPEAAQGFLHEFSGWMVFVVAFLMMLALQRLILWVVLLPRSGPSPARRQSDDDPSPRSRDVLRHGCRPARARRSTGTCACAFDLRPVPDAARRMARCAGSPLPEEILAVLGVDDYMARAYFTPTRAGVGLYVGYYGSQRQGDTMHSPQNCLPGAGWEPESNTLFTVSVPGSESAAPTPIQVNRYVIRKGLDRQLVLYWYQSHGRVVASEYWSKFYLIRDAIQLNRTDGALVRVIAPIPGNTTGANADGERRAEELAVRFVQELFPALGDYLPK
ncbi:MAG: EpsI family protein [Vicinamibacterales bacterium]